MDIKYKNILVELLVEIDRVCRLYNLRYYLIGGSLIGAVRHKGIIPWDDDIDIAMPRKDLEKLKQIREKAFNTQYELADYKSSSGYYQRFCKLYKKNTTLVEQPYPFYVGGVYIDVFALDGLPTSMSQMKIHIAKYQHQWYKLYSLYYHPKLKFSQGMKVFLRSVRDYFYHAIYTIDGQIEKCETIAMQYAFDESDYVILHQGAYCGREVWARKCFDEYILTEFEGLLIRIPKGYDEILRVVYGNYMEFPPEEKRMSNHGHYILNLERRLSIEEIKTELRKKELGSI